MYRQHIIYILLMEEGKETSICLNCYLCLYRPSWYRVPSSQPCSIWFFHAALLSILSFFYQFGCVSLSCICFYYCSLLLLLLCAFPVALCIFGAYFEASLVKTVTGAVMRWRTVYTRMQLALLIDSWSWILK